MTEHLIRPDYWRQLDVFDPTTFIEEVHIIGAGATGSVIAYLLAKMGVRKEHVYDFDRVTAHNSPNSIFGQGDVGKLKVEALAERLLYDSNTTVIPHPVAIGSPDTDFGKKLLKHNQDIKFETPKMKGIVFLCPDKMSVRQYAWEHMIKYNMGVKLMVETRLAAEFGIIHVVNPMHPIDVEAWEATLCSDDEAEESACTNRAIATTVFTISAIAAHKLIKFHQNEPMSPKVIVKEGESHSNYDLFCIRPIITTATSWE